MIEGAPVRDTCQERRFSMSGRSPPNLLSISPIFADSIVAADKTSLIAKELIDPPSAPPDDDENVPMQKSSTQNFSPSSSSCYEREPLQKTLLQLHRLLRFEDLPFHPSFLHDSDLINTKTGKASSVSSKDTDDDKKNNKNNKKKDHDEFVKIIDAEDHILAEDAVDAVNAVPSGSVSGICGHMYHCAIANSKDLKYGSDLRESLYWILSASQSSRARSATLQNLETNLSENTTTTTSK